MKEKLTSLEKKWIMYDVGNSAFILLATTVIPIVFKALAKGKLSDSTYLAYWGYAVSISTIIVALLGPSLGSIADRRKKKKAIFSVFVFLGLLGCFLLPFSKSWLLFLGLYVLAKVGFNGSLVFYDSMLTDITSEDRMDKVSSLGYAWGYIGSCIPFVISIAALSLFPKFGLKLSYAIVFSFLLTGIWWLIFTMPLFKSYEQKYFEESVHINVFKNLKSTIKEILLNKQILYFLISFFFYIDGVYTIINMATAYGSSLGLSSNGLMIALLVTQLVAFPCAIFFGRISKRKKTSSLLKICILAYTLIALYAIQLDKLYEFWVLAVGVGMFQGAIQALSRSYYAKIIPKEKSGEYFGIMDIFGKGASVIGTLLVSLISHLTGDQNKGIFAIAALFIFGYISFCYAAKENKEI
ncbi:MFS transporter [Peptoniphilus sp. GNH]|nr:transporter, major facilitator family protein [Clostridiales bacterium KA00134]UHR02101.1 MFS transporter [Peptoniphilus sp. GNH]